MSGPNWLVGNSVSTGQWESGNSQVAFPFRDDSLPAGFPEGVVVDALVTVASPDPEARGEVALCSLHAGPSLLSAIFAVGGVPALYCGVPRRSYVPFSPVVMEPMADGVSGVMAFGDVPPSMLCNLRVSVPLSDTAVVRVSTGALERFFRPDSGLSASGTVGLDLPDGVSASAVSDGGVCSISFSAGDRIRELVPSPCTGADSPASMSAPVRSVNGLSPDPMGRIAVVFLHDRKDLEGIQ